jgi:predicted AlkP superfamily pyrophosphatase or phosphodiesterase
VRDIWEAVRESKWKDKTTIIVASDHGFFAVKKEIRPNVLLKKAGLLAEGKKQAFCLSQGGACAVYILDDTQRDALATRFRKELPQIEGVAGVFGPDQFGQLGQSSPDKDPRAPDLWLAAKDGYSFVDSRDGEDIVITKPTPNGTHGYLPDQPDMLGTLIIAGHGVKQGIDLGKISNLDVAPTMAHLLGVKMPTADGKVLQAALVE